MERFFVCPVNDGEAVEIRNLFWDNGETVVITRQAWGATWQNLEDSVVAEVEGLIHNHSDTKVIGIELGGPARWNGSNIDHHKYQNDDRSNEFSSLEQIAQLLGVELSRFQRLISENDKGYIPALERFGASKDEIELVRAQDRLAQGVTPDHERQAVLDLEHAEWRGRKILVRSPKGSTSAVTDRLYGKCDEALTIDEVNGKWIYFGHRHYDFYSLTKNRVKGARWVGGAPESGYSGAEKPGGYCQAEIFKFFWS